MNSNDRNWNGPKFVDTELLTGINEREDQHWKI